jgi:hypothetical protein
MQAKEYRISGKSIRMDSKLISGNIAWYYRYEMSVSFSKKATRMSSVRKMNQV